jgi:hypothetical protein
LEERQYWPGLPSRTKAIPIGKTAALPMTLAAEAWALKQKGLRPLLKLALIALCHHANKHGYTFPSERTLAGYLEVEERSARRMIRERIEGTRISQAGAAAAWLWAEPTEGLFHRSRAKGPSVRLAALC